MAVINAFKGSDILVKIATPGEDPLVYTAYCSINGSRGVELTAETNSVVLPDCNDPQAPGWKTTTKDSLGMNVNGEGLVHRDDLGFFVDALTATGSYPCKVEIGGSGGVEFTGNFAFTTVGVTGERKEEATISISLESDGEVTNAAIS